MPIARLDTTGFFDLHRPGAPFILPNAWDTTSALALHQANFPAVGTTSLGIAASAGLRDGHGLTLERTRCLVQRVTELAPNVMVNCDIENGYHDDPQRVAELLDDLPVVGINIEDSAHGSLTDPMAHAAKITAVKDRHPDLFVNARVDTYWTGHPNLDDTLARAAQYVDAGADGIFVPGDLPSATIARITRHTPVPVNVLANRRYTRTELAEAGVSRISTGSLLYRTALTAAIRAAEALRDRAALPISNPVSYEATEALLLPQE